MPAGGFLLIIALAGLWLAGRALAFNVTADRRLALFLAPGLGTACWLISVHLTGRWTGSFWTGLEAGTAGTAAIGLAVLARSSLVSRRQSPWRAGERGRSGRAWPWLSLGPCLNGVHRAHGSGLGIS